MIEAESYATADAPRTSKDVAREVTGHLEASRRAFAQHFGPNTSASMGFVCAPGRVNLIGDHTDYNGLPVFPMAIQRHVMILFRPREDETVRLVNLDPRFSPRTFELATTIEPDPPGDWVNYVKAAAQVLAQSHGPPPLAGFDGVVSSDLPVAAGLSSSSALTVGSALAMMYGNGIRIPALDLMSLLAQGERYVGTEGGGMDQAICLGGRAGTAVKIDFHPLTLTHTPVPRQWKFVVASSLVEAAKSGAVRDEYNRRGRESRAALSAMRRQVPGASSEDGFRDLLGRASEQDLLRQSKGTMEDPLRRRFRHVVTEGARVEAARRAMVEGDLAGFGRLMSDSHRSLRDDYEVSCGPLDELVEMAIAGGASGARLTGAGFGGCVVALCTERALPAVLEKLAEEFYTPRNVPDPMSHALTIAEPAEGARVFEV